MLGSDRLAEWLLTVGRPLVDDTPSFPTQTGGLSELWCREGAPQRLRPEEQLGRVTLYIRYFFVQLSKFKRLKTFSDLSTRIILSAFILLKSACGI